MRYFPAFLDLKGKICVVVGGGRVAQRKVLSLRKAGASVKVISPELTPLLARLKEAGKIIHRPHFFRAGDLRGAFLAVAATDDRATNERVFRQASLQKILVNVVDAPPWSNFIVPSMVARGELLVAVSTSGKSPALAKWLRQKIQQEISPEYAAFLKFLGVVRQKVLSLHFDPQRIQKIFRRLIREDILSLLRKKDYPGLKNRLRIILGPEFPLEDLRFGR